MLEKVSTQKKLDPRVRRTRQMLVTALRDLLAEKSFEAITVQDIAERATLNRVTFYAHFNDKYDLLEYTMRTMFRAAVRAEIPEDAPFSANHLARLIQLVAEMLADTKGHCPPPRGQMDTLMEKQIKAELFAMLLAWLEQGSTGEMAQPASQEQAAMIASWAIYGAAVQWSEKTPREPAAEFARQVLPLIMGSLQLLAEA
jgi:AcrR family transcriptional regulator